MALGFLGKSSQEAGEPWLLLYTLEMFTVFACLALEIPDPISRQSGMFPVSLRAEPL